MSCGPAARGHPRPYGREHAVRLLFALLFTSVLSVGPARAADPDFPALSGRVVDSAGLLSADQARNLTIDLEALEEKSTDQLVVVTLPSLQGYEIEEFGYKLGRHWGIGQEGKDNGVLLIVAPEERKVRIEVGRGLEPILTDALTKLIIENGILPRFRSGDFPGGIRAGVRDIVAVLTGDAEELKVRARQSPKQTDDMISGIILFVWLIIFGIVLWSLVQSARRGNTRSAKGKSGKKKKNSGGWTWGSGGSSGGGWSSGGGGFSGGGGGFSGGGSSGSW